MIRSKGWFHQAATDLAQAQLRVLDVLYIPPRNPDSLPEGAPTDHFGRLQSSDALSHDRALLDAIRLQRWPLKQLPLSCDALVLTPKELQRDLRWML